MYSLTTTKNILCTKFSFDFWQKLILPPSTTFLPVPNFAIIHSSNDIWICFIFISQYITDSIYKSFKYFHGIFCTTSLSPQSFSYLIFSLSSCIIVTRFVRLFLRSNALCEHVFNFFPKSQLILKIVFVIGWFIKFFFLKMFLTLRSKWKKETADWFNTWNPASNLHTCTQNCVISLVVLSS